jgi:hypothetical protein
MEMGMVKGLADHRVFGRGLIIWWWSAFIAAAPLYFRLLWEQTYLTWQKGPQMIGFSLAHQHPEVLLVGLAGYAAMCGWLVVAFAIIRALWFLGRPRRRFGAVVIAVGRARPKLACSGIRSHSTGKKDATQHTHESVGREYRARGLTTIWWAERNADE